MVAQAGTRSGRRRAVWACSRRAEDVRMQMRVNVYVSRRSVSRQPVQTPRGASSDECGASAVGSWRPSGVCVPKAAQRAPTTANQCLCLATKAHLNSPLRTPRRLHFPVLITPLYAALCLCLPAMAARSTSASLAPTHPRLDPVNPSPTTPSRSPK